METRQYNDNYDDENQNQEYQRRERKQRRHHRPKEENHNEEDHYNELHSPTHKPTSPVLMANPRKSEEENFDPTQAPRRKHRSKPKNREDEYGEPAITSPTGYYDDGAVSPEPRHEPRPVGSRPKRESKRRSRDATDGAPEDPYLNINLQSPNGGGSGAGSHQNYPFEDPSESVQLDDEPRYNDDDDDELGHSDEFSKADQPAAEPKPKKKSGGFMKIFASFKKKNKAKGPEASAGINGKQWQSNPEIFNPAYDSHPGTLERSSRKIKGKSGRDLLSQKAHVILLDGMEVEFEANHKMLGKDLFDEVCRYLDLMEKDFFGMTYVNSKLQTWFWLEMEKKIGKQLTGVDDWIFNFQVKFYPPEPVLLQEDITRYQLSLQVRQDVYTGKLPCSWITQALLGSFMVQSELGDYDESEHGDGIEYLREFEFILNQSDQLLEKISELHKKHLNMSPDKADVKYLETAKRLEQYGVDLHPARDNDDVEIFIGVCYQGVLIYRDRLRIGRFAWPKVLRISYKKNYFYLKIRSDRYDDSVAIVGFKLFNHNLAKRLWKNAVEQHTFFRMKEPQNLKPMPRMIPTAASTYNYSGKTLHQYRSMNISRNEPLKFDRSVTKRRTIGSMPAGLDSAGIQYSSMHSLNRSHPRDMTLGKTKSTEYLSSKRPGSNMGTGSNRDGSLGNLHQVPQQARYPPYGTIDDRHMSFQSGDSLNAEDSYVVRNDDQVSLPPMSSRPQPEYERPYKKHNQKQSRPNDVLSDDGISPQPEPVKPRKNKHSKTPLQNDVLSDDGINSLQDHKKPVNKNSISKPVRPTDDDSDDARNPQPIYAKPLKKHSSRNSRPKDDLSDDARSPEPEYSKPLKKKHSRSSRPADLSDEDINVQPEYNKPARKQNYKPAPVADELSDDYINPDHGNVKPIKKHRSKNKDNRPDDGLAYSVPQDNRGKVTVKGDRMLAMPDPPGDSSPSEDVDPHYRVVKKRAHQKSAGSGGLPNQSRPQPPNQFRPPPPPPEPIPQMLSNTSSERSSPIEHQLPPPPPPIIDLPHVIEKPKPPPVKPKPAVKPKPKVVLKDQHIVTKHVTARYDDASSNDDML